VNSLLADRRLKRAERKQRRFEGSWRWTDAFGALCVLALAATAGVLILDRSYVSAQERPAAQGASATAPAGDAENGKRVFASAGCVYCHNGDGQGGGNAPRLAPNPTMLPLAAFVRAVREPERMTPYISDVLSDAQLADIYAFLQTVPTPPDVSSIPLLQ